MSRTITKLSPALLNRITRLDGCRGRWIVDCREIEGDYSYSLRTLRDHWQMPDGTWHREPDHEPVTGYRFNSAESAAFYCALTGWKSRLLFCSDHLNGDSGHGYTASAVLRSNERVFREEFSVELEEADGDADGISLDVRYVTDDMLETIEALEDYPLISDDDHSRLEIEEQDEAWEDWAAGDWKDAVTKELQAYTPADADSYWAEDAMEDADDGLLRELFHACCEQSGTYWHEESGSQYIDILRVATAIDRADLVDLTGLSLLPPDQEWRREAYPWPGAAPEPLVAALPA